MVLLRKTKTRWLSVPVTLSLFLLAGEAPAHPFAVTADSVRFVCRELLGRPTDHSIALNLCADRNVDAFVEYGTQPFVYGSQSSVYGLQADIPATITISTLAPDTRYYYRVRYRLTGTGEFSALGEHTFHTARPAGTPFVFAIEADPHLDEATNPDLYRRTLGNILDTHPDFLIDLGDTFMSDKLPVINQQEITLRHLLLRSFYDTLCHSVPLMLVLGNHEGELGWLLSGTPDNLPVWASTIRKSYYLNPFPDGFYSGDTTQVSFVGLRQNYYAWQWGSALFVVLDPYWYTTRKPGSSKNMWDWTLGRAQYDWFAKVLESSNAPLKFVFAHQLVGGNDTEGRGGIEAVPFVEMGGLNIDGSPGFAANRPGWPMPLHQLMVKHQVTAYFHGHDHVFVKQDLDGIVYQELPQPGYFNYNNPANSYSNVGLAAKYGYTHGVILPSSGYLRVAVTDTGATVDYIRAYLPEHENGQQRNGEVAYSYVLKTPGAATSVDQKGSDTHYLTLKQNYPNPFNPVTRIGYQVSENSFVALKVFDILGREVASLVQDLKPAGTHEVEWNASTFSSGIYYYRLTAGGHAVTGIMSLLK